MRNVQDRMKNQFSYFYFLSYRRICSQFSSIFTSITIQNFTNYFFQNCSKLHERCALSWNEWKIHFPNFPIFIFLSYSRFCTQNPPKNGPIMSTRATISQKIKIARNGKLFFHRFQHIAHYLVYSFFYIPESVFLLFFIFLHFWYFRNLFHRFYTIQVTIIHYIDYCSWNKCEKIKSLKKP